MMRCNRRMTKNRHTLDLYLGFCCSEFVENFVASFQNAKDLPAEQNRLHLLHNSIDLAAQPEALPFSISRDSEYGRVSMMLNNVNSPAN